MIVKNFSEVKEESVQIKNGEGISVRWLINDNLGLNFAMRRYDLSGVIPIHSHTHEHEIYFLEGQGDILLSHNKSQQVGPGDFAFIPPNEPHGFKNKDKQTKLVFLCMVPNKRGKPNFIS